MEQQPLEGRRILVTGASSGVGKATARLCAEAGARVACAARSEDKIATLADEIGGVAAPMDLADESSVQSAVATAAEKLGGLDGLVHCAGLMIHSKISLGMSDDWRKMVDVNILGTLYLSAAVVAPMREAGSGDIVLVSSTAAHRVSNPNFTLYAATKAALTQIASGLRQELTEDGIRVALLAPGLIRETGFGHDIRDDDLREQVLSNKGRGMSPDVIATQAISMLALHPEARIDELTIVPSWQAI